MTTRQRRKRKRDVAAASAALLFNVLPELMKLPAGELYERLTLIFEGNINAFEDVPETEFELPEQSKN